MLPYHPDWCVTSHEHKFSAFCLRVLSYLDSILPFPSILLSQFQPSHRALSMSHVVLPLTRVSVTRVVSERRDLASCIALELEMQPLQCTNIPSHSPSLSVVPHPISFVPRHLILVIIDCTLTERQPNLETILSTRRPFVTSIGS